MSHWKRAEKEGYFPEKKVHYYPDVKREDIPIILNRDYERIIFDFGDQYLLFREEILRCDQKIFMMNLNTWQVYAAQKLLQELGEQNWGGIVPFFACVHGFPGEKRKIEKTFQIKIMEISGIQNPFSIPGAFFSIMDLLLAHSVKGKKKRSLNLTRRKR